MSLIRGIAHVSSAHWSGNRNGSRRIVDEIMRSEAGLEGAFYFLHAPTSVFSP